MLKRPSARRRSKGQEQVELPLVPIMDAFVTLIAFLLLATSLLSVTLIDTPVPVVSTNPPETHDKPLTLTLRVQEEGLKLESPFHRIKTESFPKIEKGYDVDKLHEALLAVKEKFPDETKIIFMPAPTIKYDDLVQVMDVCRNYFKTDKTIFRKEKDGTTKPETNLFPEVIFGNVVSGT